jgi:hypothetical protein
MGKLKPPAIVVTDHAVIRYMERAMGIDVDAVRAKILSDCGSRAAALPNANLAIPGGLYAVVRDGAVVTIRPKGVKYEKNVS